MGIKRFAENSPGGTTAGRAAGRRRNQNASLPQNRACRQIETLPPALPAGLVGTGHHPRRHLSYEVQESLLSGSDAVALLRRASGST